VRRELAIPAPAASPVVFCGIARPPQFFEQIRAAGIMPASEIEFRDHHAYIRADIATLQAARANLKASGFLTTEKDAINLGPLQSELQPLTIAGLTLTLDRPADVVDAILARIADRSPRS